MQRGLVARNVCTLIDAPTPKVQEVEPSPVTRPGGCSTRLGLVGTQPGGSSPWRSGLRQGEALALAWPHVDLDAGTLAVRHSMTRARYAYGCGGPPTCGKRPVDCPQQTGHGPQLADVKFRAGKRVVTLPQPLVEALPAHRTAQLEERLAAGSSW